MFAVDAGRLRLQCDLTIYQADALWPALCEALDAPGIAELDLSQVGEFDSAGLQLLLMLKRRAAERERELSLVNHSAEVLQALGLVNAVGLLGDPLIEPRAERSRQT